MNDTLNKTISEIWEQEYVVPLYQRNYAWGENEIKQLIQDIYDHTPTNDSDWMDCRNYYLGSLVVMQRRDDKFEVIDGQQRLTTLHLLCRYLGILKSPRLSFDSRPQVEQFLEELFRAEDLDAFYKRYSNTDNNKLVGFVEALDIIRNSKIKTAENKEGISLSNIKEKNQTKFANFTRFLQDKVILVTTPLPNDTDVAAYFEIMNNRGEQLEPHEVVKSLLMKELTTSGERHMFANIWDACSQMDRPIQSGLSELRGKGLFGQCYDSLDMNLLKSSLLDIEDSPKDGIGIDDILNGNYPEAKAFSASDNSEDSSNYRSIIDFPNFLMQAFRLYEDFQIKSSDDSSLNTESSELEGLKAPSTPLNADLMKMERPEFIQDPMDFVKYLLRLRVLFDRYVIKIQGDENGEADLKWRILRPYLYEDKKRNTYTLRFRNTFSNKESNDDLDDDEFNQNRIIKQQSMLQVSFRQPKYKDWLYQLLYKIMQLSEHSIDIKSDDVARAIDDYIFKYATEILKREDILTAGLNTPHFLLNYIDYLYWLAWKKNYPFGEAKLIGEFSFKYLNTVEHHYPRESKSLPEIDNVDSIGNLCMMSRRKNSSLNNREPLEKANRRDNNDLQPKRRIMYETTKYESSKGRNWNCDCINAHAENVRRLISEANNLLAK